MRTADVIVVGAGPAGASCARRLRAHGIDCLLLDRRDFPREKLCAGWITPQCARDLDMSRYPYPAPRFDRFVVSIRGRTFPLPTRQYSIRRMEFDDWLVRRSGAPLVRHEVRSIRPLAGGGYELDAAFRGRVLVGAGGTGCPVRRQLFDPFAPRPVAARIDAIEEEFPCAWTDPACRLWFGEDGLPGYAWYVPKAGGILNVGVGGLFDRMAADGRNILWHWRRLTARLAAANLVRGHAFGHRGHRYYLRHGGELSRGTAYLAGDAAGLATLDLGEGIGPAVRAGLRAADAIREDRPLTAARIPRRSLPGILLAGCGILPRRGQPPDHRLEATP